MSKKTNEELAEMRRPIINQVERVDQEQILINDHPYQLELNYRDAFNSEMLAERFVGLFSRYDYLVGDVGSGQLRLKGFYDDDMQVDNAIKISRVQDYLDEYCSFGCPYFILKNLQVNERARNRWIKEQRRSDNKKKAKKKTNTNTKNKPHKPVAKRKNEVVSSNKNRKKKTFKIREKK